MASVPFLVQKSENGPDVERIEPNRYRLSVAVRMTKSFTPIEDMVDFHAAVRNDSGGAARGRGQRCHQELAVIVWFYGQRGGAENLIKEANNDAGLAAHPSGRFDVNGNHFQLAMLAYNLNCWLMLFNREPQADATELKHTTLATSRLRFLFVAAKIWRHAGRTGVSYSDHYEEKGMFERLMNRLRRITPRAQGYAPVMLPALR